jgi:hypothetical protein
MIVLQYQLLAIAARLNLIALISQKNALFLAYKHLHGTQFRQSQLAIDMLHYNTMIEEIIPTETLYNTIEISPGCTNPSITALATAYGLYSTYGALL